MRQMTCKNGEDRNACGVLGTLNKVNTAKTRNDDGQSSDQIVGSLEMTRFAFIRREYDRKLFLDT